MPRTALTDREIQGFRERAVSAATRLFGELGYEAVTMRALASALGCSPMTPYRYFENRDELFAMVRAEAFRRFAERQQRAYQGAADDPGDALRRLKRAYIDFALEEPDAYRIMFELRQAPAGRYPALDEQGRRAFSYLLRAVEGAVSAGILNGDPLTVAHLLWAHTHGLVSLHLAGKLCGGRSLEELADAALPAFGPGGPSGG